MLTLENSELFSASFLNNFEGQILLSRLILCVFDITLLWKHIVFNMYLLWNYCAFTVEMYHEFIIDLQ